MARKREVIEVGSGDVFVDLGLADAGERKLRVQLAMQVNELIARRRLTQANAAALLGIPQPHVSELKHYKLSRFSSERLLRFLTLLSDAEPPVTETILRHVLRQEIPEYLHDTVPRRGGPRRKSTKR